MILFGVPVMVYDNLLHDVYFKKISHWVKEAEKNTENSAQDWECDVYSTCHSLNLKHEPIFDWYHTSVDEKVKHYMYTFGSSEELEAEQTWFNSYKAKQFQDRHKHPNVQLSCVYFLDAPLGSAPLIFHNPVDPDTTFSRQPEHEVYALSKSVNAVTNRLIVFPSWAVHSVPQGDNTELRYTIASNYGRVKHGISTTKNPTEA